MKHIRMPPILGLLMLLALGCGKGEAPDAKNSKDTADATRKGADEKSADEGKPFTSEEDGFTIVFPAKATAPEEIEPIKGTHVVKCKLADQTSCQVLVVTLPEALLKALTTEKRFDNVRDGLVERYKGKLIADKTVSLDENAGREFQIELPNHSVYRERLYQVKEQMFRLLVLGPKNTVTSAAIDRFLDSLKLTGNKE